MQKSEYLNPEYWAGGFYELAIPIIHTDDKERFGNAIRIIWEQPHLSGIWREKEDYPNKTSTVPDAYSGYGLLTLPGKNSVGCEIILIPEPHADWVDLCIPVGMLERVFDLNYPLLPSANPWMATVDEVLVSIAEAVYREVAFALALVGEEVSGYADEYTFRKEYLKTGAYLLSPEFHARMGIEEKGIILPSGLCWFPQSLG